MHERKKLQKLWNRIPGEGWLHSPVLQVQRVKWRSSSLVWLAVEVAAVNEEEEPQYILLDLWTQQPELSICSLGAGWRVARVCGGSDFSALILSHHMMLNFCQWNTSFSLPKLAFPANHYVCPTQSFTLPICLPCGTCQREQILHEKLLYNLWPWAETADLTTQQPLPGNFWMTLQKSKTES